jgi:hypothetical protein
MMFKNTSMLSDKMLSEIFVPKNLKFEAIQ